MTEEHNLEMTEVGTIQAKRLGKWNAVFKFQRNLPSSKNINTASSWICFPGGLLALEIYNSTASVCTFVNISCRTLQKLTHLHNVACSALVVTTEKDKFNSGAS